MGEEFNTLAAATVQSALQNLRPAEGIDSSMEALQPLIAAVEKALRAEHVKGLQWARNHITDHQTIDRRVHALIEEGKP